MHSHYTLLRFCMHFQCDHTPCPHRNCMHQHERVCVTAVADALVLLHQVGPSAEHEVTLLSKPYQSQNPNSNRTKVELNIRPTHEYTLEVQNLHPEPTAEPHAEPKPPNAEPNL